MDKKLQAKVDSLKSQPTHTRDDIAKLLASIAPPGKKRVTKVKAVELLQRSNTQGYNLAETLSSYQEF